MKLLNREPTEEMILSGNNAMGSSDGRLHTFRGVFRAMYDAAPEIKIDMEPVAWVQDESMTYTRMCLMDTELDDAAKVGMTPLYSAEQVAKIQHKANQAVLDAANTALSERNALQAENERLREANKEAAISLDTLATSVYVLTTDRDELLSALKGLVRAGQKQGFADSYEAEMEAANKAIVRAAAEIGKMEGEKES